MAPTRSLALLLCLAAVVGEAAAQKKRDPDRKPAPRLEPEVEPSTKGTAARLGTRRFWHPGRIGALAVSPDGKLVATGESMGPWKPSADGGWSADAHQTRIRLWNADTGQQLHTVGTAGRGIEGLAFSPDGRRLAVSSFSDVWMYEVSHTGKLGQRTKTESARRNVRFSRDGNILITEDVFGASTWDARTGKKIREWSCPEKRVSIGDETVEEPWGLRLSPEGRLLACRMKAYARSSSGGGERVKVYDAATGKMLFATQRFPRSVRFAFSPDSKHIAIGGSTVIILSMAHKKPPLEFPADDDALPSLFFSANGKVLAVVQSARGLVRCWDLTRRRKLSAFTVGALKISGRRSVPAALSADGTAFWLGHDHTVRCWDVRTGKEQGDSPGHRRPVTSLTFSADGKRLSSACDQAVCEWDVGRGRPLARLLFRHPERGRLLALSAFLRRSVWESAEGSHDLLELTTGKLVRQIKASEGDYSFLGRTLLCQPAEGSDGAKCLRYDAETGKEMGTFLTEDRALASRATLTPSPDGKVWASCSSQGTIMLLNPETGKVLHRFPEKVILVREDQPAPLYRLVFSGDGEYLASVFKEEPDGPAQDRRQQNAIQIWHVASGREVARVRVAPQKGERFVVAGLAVSPDHRLVAFGMYGDSTVRVWEVASESERARLTGHGAVVTSAAFSPDGKYLAAGSADTTILVWDLDRPPSGKLRLSEKELALRWEALGGRDAARAEEAIWMLVSAAEQSVPYLQQRLRPLRLPTEEQRRALLVRLDSGRPAVRRQAQEELRLLGGLIRPVLQKVLEGKPSLEVRRRLEELLEDCDRPATSPQRLQRWRALEVLERAGSPESRQLLRLLAGGAPESRWTRAARASLRRSERKAARMD